MDLIRLANIKKTYHLGEIDVPVLHGVSLSIRKGEYVALMGASGSGKTTLMNILGCLDRTSSGSYQFEGREIESLSETERASIRNSKIGFVFQSFNLLTRTTAFDNVIMPLEYADSATPEKERQQRAVELLERVGLGERMHHEPKQMSGGQQQRVAIARALLNRPPLVLADEPTGNLDSKTSLEILDLFDELHRDGAAIIVVTHDPEVANRAQRVIHVKDGLIEGEDAAHSSGERPRATASRETVIPETTAQSKAEAIRRSGWAMPRVAKTAIKAIRRNMLRSALTTLGIIIGVAAVIAMMEIGAGSKRALEASIEAMGADNLVIQSGTATSGGISFGSGTLLTLTQDDAEDISLYCPAVVDTAPLIRTRTQVIYGNRNWVPFYVYGTSANYLRIRDWELLEEGEMFTDRDVRNQSKVCLLGQTLVRELFQGESPVGKEIRVQNVALKVIGVLTRKGANMTGMDQDDLVLAPWTTIKYRVAGVSVENSNQSAVAAATDPAHQINTLNKLYPGTSALYPVPSAAQLMNTPQPVRFSNVDQILVRAITPEQIPEVIRQCTNVLRERHRLRPGEPNDFSFRDMTELTKSLAETSALMGSLLLSVALISLVVGGVGIMNIMLVSVTERTREIGLRMAVGASPGKILQQFLVEAVLLCLFGGAMGIAIGRGVSIMLRTVLKWPTEPSLTAIIAAAGVSVTIGIIFGYYPAWRASRLDPIEALRYE